MKKSFKKRTVPLRLGGVYYNSRHNTVIIDFLDKDANVVGYEHLVNGTRRGNGSATVAQMRRLLARGNYRLDHIDMGC